MYIQKQQLGPWEFNVGNQIVRMTVPEVASLSRYLRDWQACFPGSQNLAERRFGVKSALVRFDYTLEESTVRVYEVEERPAGLGVSSALSPQFMGEMKRYIGEQEAALDAEFAIYVSKERDGSSDDQIFSSLAGFTLFQGAVDDYTFRARAWYVRASRHELDVDERFNARSLSTIRNEGNKSYGLPLGLWTEFGTGWEPDWSEAFAVKPRCGSRFEEVLLWHPNSKNYSAGFATRTKITSAIREGKISFRQCFHAPENLDIDSKRFQRIRRAYFIWSPVRKEYVCVGGLWVATPTARVHGTRDSVCGTMLPA